MCQWLFDTMCGINVGEIPNTFIIKPTPGGKIQYAKASYNSIYGLTQSSWEKKDGKILSTITIPSNTSAEIILPNGRVERVTAGEHHFEQGAFTSKF